MLFDAFIGMTSRVVILPMLQSKPNHLSGINLYSYMRQSRKE